MTPVERAVALLRLHTFDTSSSRRDCLCGWQEGDDYHGSHASHVAGVLADAGLIPTVQEWGVKHWDRSVRLCATERGARLIRDIGTSGPTLLTRFTGATAWTAEEWL